MELDTPEGTLNLLRRWIAMSPGERGQMAENALHSFHLHYDMQQTAKTIIQIFELALQSQKKS